MSQRPPSRWPPEDRPRQQFSQDRPHRVLTPEHWGPRGEAMGADGDRRILYWQGIPGETARYRLQHPGQNQDLWTWQSAKRADVNRVEPPCNRYHPCGGCPLMHLDETGQVRARRSLLQATLAARDLQDVPLDALVPSPDGLVGFRHVVKLVAGFSDQGRPRIGAPGRYTRRIVPIPECDVLQPQLRRVARELAFAAIDLKLRPWTQERGGLLRWLVARRSSITGEILVTVVASSHPRILNEYAERIAETCPDVVGVHLHMNQEPGNAIFAADMLGVVGTKPLVGSPVITEQVGGVELRVGPGDFFQTNPALARVIADDLIELGEIKEGVPVVDLYCGVGAFTLALAKKSGWAVGVEANDGAIQRARESARNAGLMSAEFIPAPVLEALPRLVKRLEGRHPVVVVDPARRGLEDGVMEGLVQLAPRRVLYISCNPHALVRDLARFRDAGWRVRRLRPYDMFPNTAHQEVLAVIDPPEGLADGPTRRGPRRRVVR